MYTTALHSNAINDVLSVIDEKNSPFASYLGETAKSYTPMFPRYVAITELDKLILSQVNKYRILTVALLHQILLNLGKTNVTELTVKYRLRELSDGQFLTKTQFFNNRGAKTIYCYSMGYRGRGLLKALSIDQNLSGYISALGNDSVRIKKILATNQFLIRTCVPTNNIEICQAVFAKQMFKNSTDYVFRPQAVIQEDTGTRIIEAVRRDNGWEEELTNKLDRVATVLKRKAHNIPLTNPSLTLIAENRVHMKEVMELVQHKYRFPITYACDTMIFQTPDNCTYQVSREGVFGAILKKVAGF